MPPNKQNLRKLTTEQAREIGKKGGKASVKAKKERKLMSQIYADFLAKEHDILNAKGIKEKISGDVMLSRVMSKVLSRGDSSAVSLMKEIREATEGSKVNVETTLNINSDDPSTKALLEKHGIKSKD
jgi:ribosomal protein L15